MALFSERNNITPKKAFQIEKLDENTRNRIFNQIYECYNSHSCYNGKSKYKNTKNYSKKNNNGHEKCYHKYSPA